MLHCLMVSGIAVVFGFTDISTICLVFFSIVGCDIEGCSDWIYIEITEGGEILWSGQ